MSDLPYRAEYAKSSRSSCKSCKEHIEKGVLRLAVMVQSHLFDGKSPHWYHFHCFNIQRVNRVGDISHFESLRWEDQEKIKNAIEGNSSGDAGKEDKKGQGKAKATKSAEKRKSTAKTGGLDDYDVEYAKSNRSKCKGCEEMISKGELRISKKEYDSVEAKRFGPIKQWHHLECFSKLRKEFKFWNAASDIPGFKTLKDKDMEEMMQKLPAIEPDKSEKAVEAPKDEVDFVAPSKKMKSDEDKMRKQNQTLYKYRDQLKELKKPQLVSLLEANNQAVPVGADRILDRLADAMTFGALLPCEECGHGQLVFRSGHGYQCLAKSEWKQCNATTRDPKRKKFKVPKELKEKIPFLESYKSKVETRLLQDIASSSSQEDLVSSSSKSENTTKSGPRVVRELPFRGMSFFIVGNFEPDKLESLKEEVIKMGGKVNRKVHNDTTVLISTEDEIKKMKSPIKLAKKYGIQIVPEEFIKESKHGGALGNILKMNLVSWGSDPATRVKTQTMMTDEPDSKSKSSKSKSYYTSGVPSKRKLKVKGGVAVDPDSELEDVAHVLKFGDDIYNSSLSLTDLQTGRNSYYKLQILEGDHQKSYWLFRSWGRIGTTIGGKKVEQKSSMEDAIEQFESLFEEKSGNMWCNRKNFRKVPGRMVPVDICYEDESMKKVKNEVPSKLPEPVQDLMSLIFNVNSMKNVMLEFELDLEKMPLGKLSRKQIEDAYAVLGKIQSALRDVEKNKNELIGYCNNFYSLIPHDYGEDNPPLLVTQEAVKEKLTILENLLEIEIAYSMLKSSEEVEGMNELDSHYKQLKTDLDILSQESDEFKLIEKYLKNTHGKTHMGYSLEIEQVFKVKRHGEDKRYKPFKKLHNRKLLWHGSRLTNYAGILSQGLRIAPPEAPVSGYMFGKGIYFADMVSKSANYCMSSKLNDTGLLILCEVALGDMYECKQAESIKKLPAGKNSCKGVGQTEPDPTKTVIREDGVEVPIGEGVKSKVKSSLLYNEYIVYDVAQVNVQYLIKTKFNYKY